MRKKVTKKRFKQMMFIGLAALMASQTVLVNSSLSVKAASLKTEISENLLNELEDEDVNISDSLELEHGVIHLEQNENYRLVYIVYDDGKVEYSIAYPDNPLLIHNGEYQLESNVAKNIAPNNMVNILTNLETENIVDFSLRPTEYLTSANALTAIKNAHSDYRTPGTTSLGSTTRNGVTAKTTESILGTMKQVSVVKYYIGDSMTSILAALTFKTLGTYLGVITTTYNLLKGYIASKNGTAAYFTYNNTRTKVAGINGTTYYWAGHDVKYEAYFGDKGANTKRTLNTKHSDYGNTATYFNNKALDNYFK